MAVYTRYINNLNIYLDKKSKNIIVKDVSSNFLLDYEKFSTKYISDITNQILDHPDFLNGRASLDIFLKLINLKKDSLFRSLKKDGIIFVEIFINSMIADPYKSNKKYDLKMSIDKLDEIYKIISETFNPNNINRVKYIFSKLFKSQYMEEITFWNLINDKYKITDTYIFELLHTHENNMYVTLEKNYRKELYITKFLLDLNKSGYNNEITLQDNIKLDDLQKNILIKSLNNTLTVITGKPGSGKSEIIGYIMDHIPNTIMLAPTGCAVENYQKRFVKHKNSSFTLHSFYYKSKMQTDNKIGDFYRTINKCIIIDEFSMVDIFIFYKILLKIEKYKNELKIILVGDPNQLPSIKLGQLLKDFIDSGKFLVYNLEKCYRSNEGIVKTLNHLLKNKRIGTSKNAVETFYYTEPQDLKKISGENIYEYFYDIDKIILSPTNAAVDIINLYIQDKNPNNVLYTSDSINFKKNDKVIFLKNNNDYNLYNGTILYIDNVDHNGYEATFKFNEDKNFKCNVNEVSKYIKLCYASTIHKAQGKGYKVVVALFNIFPKIMWDTKLIYTAISRAKDICYISGNADIIQKACTIGKVKLTSIPDILKI